MNDLISRRAAVSRISDLLLIELKGRRLPTWNEVYRAINELPSAQPEQRWIPVTERLPEKDGRYMVTFRDNVYFSPFEDGEWYIDGVTAWQEIPESYRKETEDAEIH